MTHQAETELRALWTAEGVSPERQQQLIDQITWKATPIFWGGFWNNLKDENNVEQD